MPCVAMLKETPKITQIKWSGGEAARQLVLRHRDGLEKAWPLIVEAMAPTSVAEINTVVETLTQMYFERERDAEQYDLFLDAYTKAVSHWPTDLLWLATREWIANGKGHMPAPSDLKRCIEKTYKERWSIYTRARIAVEWLRANPDERPFVETAKTREMSRRLREAITKSIKAKDKGDVPTRETIKEIAMHRGQPDADAAKADIDERREERRAEQARRAAQFLKEHRAKNPEQYDRSILEEKTDDR